MKGLNLLDSRTFATLSTSGFRGNDKVEIIYLIALRNGYQVVTLR